MIASQGTQTKAPTPRMTTGNQPCGCAAPVETCCALDCLVQPRFFCGQLLTDADLTAIVRYCEERFRLLRYRDGWGVVCGLEVRCDSAESVVVEAGYAVDCCGNDLVVCSPQHVSLAARCKAPQDDCVQLGKGKAVTPSAGPTLPGLPAGELVGFDLFLRYAAEGMAPQVAMGRSACGEIGLCQDSRTLITGVVDPLPVTQPVATAKPQPANEPFRACLEVVETFPFWQEVSKTPKTKAQVEAGVKAAPQTAATTSPDEVRAWLARWLKHQPLRRLCYVKQLVCGPGGADLSKENEVALILFLLVQDCWSGLAAAQCEPCADEERHGVPLGRVWVQRQAEARTTICRVMAIDDRPPYRRSLSGSGTRPDPDAVSVIPALWQRPEEATAILAALGVRVRDIAPFAVGKTVSELRTNLKALRATVSSGEQVQLSTFTFDALGERVVGVI